MEWINLFIYSIKFYEALLDTVHNTGAMAMNKYY